MTLLPAVFFLQSFFTHFRLMACQISDYRDPDCIHIPSTDAVNLPGEYTGQEVLSQSISGDK